MHFLVESRDEQYKEKERILTLLLLCVAYIFPSFIMKTDEVNAYFHF